MQIIKSLLDTDLYTFTVQQLVFFKHTNLSVKYKFKWRNWKDMSLNISLKDFVGRLKEQLNAFCSLTFTEEELSYLSSVPYFKKEYISYLRVFKPNRNYIKVSLDINNELQIIIDGPWLETIIFEVPVLAIISQLYTEHSTQADQKNLFKIGAQILKNKWEAIKLDKPAESFRFSDFGTRRRASFDWHYSILNQLLDNVGIHLSGTSNVYFAQRLGLTPVGTMSHQFLQAYQQIKGGDIIDSQSRALQDWADLYRGDLGIALSDCLTFDFFLKNTFDKYFAKLYDGCRHDSGSPYVWATKLINHYLKLGIDPKSKTAVFSDGLDFRNAMNIHWSYSNKINCSFGIGTDLTNSCGFIAPQIVIKMVECDGKPVAKISDSEGKGMCEDSGYEKHLREIITEHTTIQQMGYQSFILGPTSTLLTDRLHKKL